MSFRQLIRNLRKADKREEREKLITQKINSLLNQLKNKEITGQQLNQSLEEILYDMRMGKL